MITPDRPCRRHHRRARCALTNNERAAIHAAVDALPPLTDDQVDGLCEVILNARHRARTDP